MRPRQTVALLLAVLLLLLLPSCDYVSSYSAIGLVRESRDNYCHAQFHQLKGTLVLKPRFTEGAEGCLEYTAYLSEGEINVYYDCCGVKSLLFNLKAGEEIDGERGGYIERGRQTVIIETVGTAKGAVSVSLVS